MSLFYVGINPRWQQFSWYPRGINIMLSAGGYWDRSSWRQTANFPKRAGGRWLDSGGFTLLNKYGDYPFTPMQYICLIGFVRPQWFASLDYPCEPEITRQLNLMTNAERIRKTVDNARALSDIESMAWPALMVPVIQGYQLDEYLSCIEMYKSTDLIREYMAVGSMCRRISSDDLHRIIPAIHKAAVEAGAKKLHFFGLKLSPDLIDLSQYIYSRDSAVALDAYDPALRRARGGRRWPKGPDEKKASFESFFRRIEDMGMNYKQVTP